MESNPEAMSIVEESDSSQEKSKKNLIEEGELHEDGQISNKGDEEDIPDDFFDDFSNQDFMDGLDIVDAWDETVKNKKLKEEKDKEEKRRDRRKIGERRSRTPERDRRRRSTERRKRSRDRRHRENSPLKKKPVDDVELRRDPSKTKRDLEKDRENYVKKKEQKFISKVVETGLVPPGMETEVNLSELENKSTEVKEVTEIIKSKKETSKGEHQKLKLQTENRDTRDRRRRRSRSFERGSPIYRGRSKGRSNERKRERSRCRRDRSRERIRRSRERSFGKNHGVSTFSPSPIRRRRSRSLSERQRRLKLRRSNSPERKYRERLGEEKLSFLEELKMKLDGFPNNHPNPEYTFPPNSGQQNFMQHGPLNNFLPQPMQMISPVQNQYFPHNSNSPYDQNFFIGDSQRLPPNNHSNLNVQPQRHGPPAPVLPPSQHMPIHQSLLGEFGGSPQNTGHALKPVPPPPGSTSGVNNVVKLMEQIKASTAMIKQSGNATQLLEEKKLSLTDYLSMNSRPSAFSSNPEALQKKVNVLSRCQDILKELTGDKKFGGKLIVMKSSRNQQVEPQVKNVSPLLRKEPVRFSYTTPSKNAEKSTFQNILNRALIKAGVISLVIDLDDDEKPAELVPPPPKIGKQKSAPFGMKSIESKRVLMKMCQTDPMYCEDCEKRKAIQFKNIGIQCGETERYNVGIQVYEMDIINSKIPKNQSLAYLTPAQLLGRSDSTSTKVDNFGSPYGKSTVPQPYREWPRGYPDPDQRRIDFANPSYPGSAMRDPQRFPRY